MNINAIVKLEAIERTEGACAGIWDIVTTYADGSRTIFGNCHKERGAVSMVTQHAKRFNLKKVNKHLAIGE